LSIPAFLLAALLAAAASPKPGATPAAAPRKGGCEVRVNNRTSYRVLVHFDGVYWGWVSPQHSFAFTGLSRGTVIAYGTTQFAEFFWGPQPLKCEGTASWDVTL